MQQIEEGYGLRCSGGSRAFNLCISVNCTSNAIVCENQECQCHNPHLRCPSTTSLSKLKRVFDQKNKSLLPLINLVYESLWRQSKLLNIEMQELKKKIESQEFAFTESENKLFALLVGKKSQGILPKLVNQALCSLEKQPEHNISRKMIDKKRELEKIENELKRMLEGIRNPTQIKIEKFVSPLDVVRTVPISRPQTRNISPKKKYKDEPKEIRFKFNPALKHCQLTLVNDNTVKLNKLSGNGLQAFLQPSISPSQKCKIQFRINQTSNNDFMFGVCQLTSDLRTKSQIYLLIEYGSFTYCFQEFFLGSKQGHREVSNNIDQYFTHDLVEIQYGGQSQKVTVRNITQKTQSVSYIKTDSTLPLYFGVILNNQGDEVSIVKGELF